MESYPTLKYLNISILYEYLNSSNYTEFSEISIYNIIRSCPKLQQLDLDFCGISDITIEEIVRSLYRNFKFS
ncbi:hypothetical protein RhiirA4_480358, partial [Rhizophagus irregularis]